MEDLVVEHYSTFIANSESAAEDKSSQLSIAKGRSRRNRRACQLLMADEFVNLGGSKRRQPPRSDKQMTDAADNSTPPIKYRVGCLVWARISGHPWWPCMVCNDADGSQEYTRLTGPRRSRRSSFVEFFGPSVEHAWIADTALIEYKGMEEFKNYAQKQVDEARSKVIKEKLAERFQLKVALSKRASWEEAVKEADNVVKLSIEERLKWRKAKLDQIQQRNLSLKVATSKKSTTIPSVSSSTKRRPSSVSFHSEEKKSGIRKSDTFTKIEPSENAKESPKQSARNSVDTMGTDIAKPVLPRRLDSCLYCKTSFDERKSRPTEIVGHLMSCSKASPSKRLLRCPFCCCSFRQPRWNLQRKKTHISNCARKVYAKAPDDKSRQINDEPKSKLRLSTRLSSTAAAPTMTTMVQSRPIRTYEITPVLKQRLRDSPERKKEFLSQPLGTVTTTLSTPTTRRLLIKYPPRLYGRRSLVTPTTPMNGTSNKLASNEIIEPKPAGRNTSTIKSTEPEINNRMERLPQMPKASLTANELQERLNQRYQALEAVARGTSLSDASLRFQLPRSVIEADFDGDFSSIANKAVILGRLDLATKDIEEGTRASMAALKYRLPYKYLLMVIRGKSQECAVEQFYKDFDQWKEDNLKRSGDNVKPSTPFDSPAKKPKLALGTPSSKLITKPRLDSFVSSEELSQFDLHAPISNSLYTIIDDESNDNNALSEEEELQIVRLVSKLPDKLQAGHLAISTAKQILQSKEAKCSDVGKDWWHFMLLKYPAMRHCLLNYYHQKQLEQHTSKLTGCPSSITEEEFKPLTPLAVSGQQRISVNPAERSHSTVRKSARIAKRKN